MPVLVLFGFLVGFVCLLGFLKGNIILSMTSVRVQVSLLRQRWHLGP